MAEPFSTFNGYEVKDAVARKKLNCIATPEEYGAAGDGVTNDTEAINAALTEKQIVMLTAGKTYAIEAKEPYGVHIPSGRMLIGNGATLKVITNSLSSYTAVSFWESSDCYLENLRIVGDRKTHEGTEGEHGHLVSLSRGSNITVRDCVISDAWGDGVYANGCENVYLDHITCDNCRRNGISIISATDFLCTNSTFSNTNGTPPQYGIGIEANYETDVTKNIVFDGCKSVGSAGNGGMYATVRGANSYVEFRNCYSDKSVAFDSMSGANNVFVMKNCYVLPQPGSACVVVGYMNETDSIEVDGCIFDCKNGTDNILWNQQEIHNLTIKNCLVKNGTLKTPIAASGGANQNNLYFDVVLDNVSFSDLFSRKIRADRGSCHIRMQNKKPTRLSGATECYYEKFYFSAEAEGETACKICNIYPGTVYCGINDGDVSAVVEFEYNVSFDGNLTKTVTVPPDGCLRFECTNTNRWLCWVV